MANLNLIIVSINLDSKSPQCKLYDNLCKQTKEGFFVNIDIGHIEDNN
jgi:hypothetical protein